MTQLFDSHTHSLHSFDGSERVEDMCKSAIEKNVSALAITDHCDLGIYLVEDWRERLSAAYNDVVWARERFGNKLYIGFGVELGQPMHDEELAQKVVAAFDYDVILGSVHNMRDTEDFYFLTSPDIDKRELLDRYFAEEAELSRRLDFDVLAHLTYAYRYLGHGENIPEPREYEELLRELFKTLAQNHKALEVNTSGLSKAPKGEIMPKLWELKLFKECGGELVTLGSDAHKATNIAGGIKEGQELLREAGFSYQAFYRSRKPQMFRL